MVGLNVRREYKHSKKEKARQLEHVRRLTLSELGLTSPGSREFWTMMMVFVATFFVRIYVHYIGQWLFLTGLGIPVSG